MGRSLLFVLLLSAAAAWLLAGCDAPSEKLGTLRIPVSDSTNWTSTVMCSHQTNSYYWLHQPLIVWSFTRASDSLVWIRQRGFMMVPLKDVTIASDDIRSCTLNYFRRGSGGVPPVLHDCAVDIPRTPAELLFPEGEVTSVVAVDTGTSAGWHRLVLTEVGLGTLKDKVRLGVKGIGYCFDYHGTGQEAGEAEGHDSPNRPYLTIVYARH